MARLPPSQAWTARQSRCGKQRAVWLFSPNPPIPNLTLCVIPDPNPNPNPNPSPLVTTGGATINWGKLQAQLKTQGGPGYAAAESTVAKSLAVRDTGDASAKVSAVCHTGLDPRTCSRPLT